MGLTEFAWATTSNLIATVLGVLVGVPAALHVSKRGSDASRRTQALAMRGAALVSLTIVQDALLYNTVVLNRSVTKIAEGEVVHNLDLRLTALEVAMPGLSNAQVDAHLLQILSHHWLRLAFYNRLNEKMFSRELGEYEWRDEDQRRTMWIEFVELTRALRFHCDELHSMVESAMASLKASGPS